MDFFDKLLSASENNRSLLCIGLDPDPERIPAADVLAFNIEIIDATSDLVCAYKPNLAFYEALGTTGLKALERTVAHIPRSIPVIGDAKRGDVSSTSKVYASAMFDVLGFDAVTVSPYLGHDSIEPFLDYRDRGVFILCRTSNAGASDFQDLVLHDAADDRRAPLYEHIAWKALEWNTRKNVGLVVGATYPEQLRRVREICPDLPLLIPGVGAQGGDLELTVKYGTDSRGQKAIISSSRQILYASKGGDFAQAAQREALILRDLINLHVSAKR